MNTTLEVDLSEFKRTLNAYLLKTSKSLPAAINNKAGRVAWRALSTTKKADRKEIEALGVSGYRVMRSRQTGAFRQGRPIYNEGGRMRDILVAKELKSGRRDFSDMGSRVRKAIAARLSSISFLRAGWLPAYRALKRHIAGAAGLVDARQRGRAKGYARQAVDGFNPVAVIANNAPPSEQAAKFVEQGLGAAFRIETADMKTYLERKLKEDARALGIQTRG